jgi:hypothetical protein
MLRQAFDMVGGDSEGLLTGDKRLDTVCQYLPIISGDIQLAQVDDFTLPGTAVSPVCLHQAMGNEGFGIALVMFADFFNEHMARSIAQSGAYVKHCLLVWGTTNSSQLQEYPNTLIFRS